jgi:adenylate kinase
LHASKNKQKVTSRTNWANARGYYSTSSIVNANAVDSEAVTTTTATKSPPKIIIAGAPASGKGTQCAIIQSKYGVIHLSTGDMLRAAVAAKTEVGVLAQEYMDAGKLVPDEVIIGVVSLCTLIYNGCTLIE